MSWRTGTGWPSKEERNARLKASVDAMRALWSGETVTMNRDGVMVERATLHVRPPRAPMIVAAALSPETARWAAPWCDALITVSADREAIANAPALESIEAALSRTETGPPFSII